MNIVVICSKCGAVCPSTWVNGQREWLWEGPKCEKCGAEAWAAHDPNRDWRTGKPLEAPSRFAPKD